MLKKAFMRLTWATLCFCHPTWQPSLLLPHSASPWRCGQLPPDCSGGPAAHVWRCPNLWRFDRLAELPHTWLPSHAVISGAAMNKKPISRNFVARTYLLSACMALAYWRCIFGEEMFGSNSPTFNLSAKRERNVIVSRREISRALRECCPFLTSSWIECRPMQPCHNTGLSHRAEQLQRIALRKKGKEESVFMFLVLDFQF